MDVFLVKSFAKINLGLLITSKRADGYHTLQTVFAPIEWYDVIGFSRSDRLSMRCTDPALPVDEDNLCLKAARALREEAGIKEGIEMTLDKRIPFGAGLGGGSSDAATVLGTLNTIWDIGASAADLHRLAVKLGADVSYFLDMKALAFAGGVGDELEDLGFTLPFHVVTVFPEEQISTVWAYRHFYPRFGRVVPDLRSAVRRLCLDIDLSVLGVFENDFEPAVFDHYPKVKALKQQLLEAGADYASLSGSGSAVFGFFRSRDTALEAVGMAQRQGFRSTLTGPGFSLRE